MALFSDVFCKDEKYYLLTLSLDEIAIMMGRIVVLPEYRRQGIGTLVVREAEAWAKEQGFPTAGVESRDNKIPFYEAMDYVADLDRREDYYVLLTARDNCQKQYLMQGIPRSFNSTQ